MSHDGQLTWYLLLLSGKWVGRNSGISGKMFISPESLTQETANDFY
jgi:hypothetical protein